MILDIQLIKSSSMFCLESAAASITKWMNRNYEMMFCRMWGFSYTNEDPNFKGVIGKRIHADFMEEDELTLLEEYHGLKMIKIDFRITNDLIKKVIRNLNNRIPVVFSPKIGEYYLIIGYDDSSFFYFDVHIPISPSVQSLIVPVLSCGILLDTTLYINFFLSFSNLLLTRITTSVSVNIISKYFGTSFLTMIVPSSINSSLASL